MLRCQMLVNAKLCIAGALTQVVHNMRFAPWRSMWPRFSISVTTGSRVKQQIVNLFLAQSLKSLFGKRLDALQVVQLQREDSDLVQRPIILELIIRLLRSLRVACSKQDSVWLALLEELFNSFQALVLLAMLQSRIGWLGVRFRMKYRLPQQFSEQSSSLQSQVKNIVWSGRNSWEYVLQVFKGEEVQRGSSASVT